MLLFIKFMFTFISGMPSALTLTLKTKFKRYAKVKVKVNLNMNININHKSINVKLNVILIKFVIFVSIWDCITNCFHC